MASSRLPGRRPEESRSPDESGRRRPGPQRTLRLTLAYDGTPFVGWQRQAEGVSVQALVEEALGRIEGTRVTVVGAGRTDAGVHACGQVASVRLTAALEVATLVRAMNATLPPEIRILGVDEVAPSFHARYAAASKTYRYHIVTGPLATPFEWRYAWHLREPLELARMVAAAACFEGEHDFGAFQATGGSVKTSVRRVYSSRVSRVEHDGQDTGWIWGAAAPDVPGTERLVYEVKANGFLRHMVRAMVGTLVEVGGGRRPVESIATALKSGNRKDAGATAPACGLCLVGVDY